jgi:hypothetical protein
MDVNVLHNHLLLALAAVSVERFEQGCERPGELIRLREVLAPSLEGLLANHGAAITFHRGIVGT